jgi:hypothetical protein
METTEQTKIDIASLKPMKSGEPVDLKKFHNTPVDIEKVEVMQVPSQFTPKGPDGKNISQWVLKVSSPILLSVGEGDTKIEFRASELFNLTQDKDGKLLGYPTNKDSNLVKFMKDAGASNPNELIGKKVTVKHYEKDIGEGQTRGFLKFKF